MNSHLVKWWKKIFTVVCMLVPILRLYEINGIELSAWCFLLLGIITLFTHLILGKGIYPNRYLWPVMVVLVGHLIWQIASDGNWLGMCHYSSYSVMIFLFIPYLFDDEFGLRVYKFVVLSSSVFAIIQFWTLKIFGYYLQGTLPGSEIYEWGVEMNSGFIAQGMAMRPRSFFGEPSDFGAYVGIFLVLLLFSEKKLSQKGMRVVLLLSLGLICTRSSTGILLLAGAWSGYLLRQFIFKQTTKIQLLLSLLFIISAIVFLYTETFQIFAERTFHFDTQGGIMGRIGNYGMALDISKFKIWQMIFGHGVAETVGFLPGWLVVWWYFGLLGVGAWICYIISLYKASQNTQQKNICRLLIVMGFFLTTFFYMHEITYIGVYYAYGCDNKKVLGEYFT